MSSPKVWECSYSGIFVLPDLPLLVDLPFPTHLHGLFLSCTPPVACSAHLNLD